MTMQPRERIPFSAIVDRPPLKLPGGARVIVWTIVNLEVWDIAKPMARQVLPAPTGVPLLPDVPNWSWHEYGMRVGFWRFKALFDRLAIRPTLSVNARVCLDYPRVAEACRDAGWEFMGHSFEQGPIHKEADQKAMIARSLDTIEKFTGKRPVGWLGAGLAETWNTLEYLSAGGVRYVCDWVNDEQPYTMQVGQPPMVSLPYSLQCNDVPAYFDFKNSVSEFEATLKRQFDVLYRDSAESGRVMAIAVHPFVSGQPHRVVALERALEYICGHEGVWLATGWEIVQHYLASDFAKQV